MREELIKMAIVGTDHHSAKMTAQELLEYFAVHQVQKQASYIPHISNQDLTQAVPPTDKRLCDERTIEQFWELKNSNTPLLLSIWISKFDEEGLSLPKELLPFLIKRLGLLKLQALFGELTLWFLREFDEEKWAEVSSKHSVGDSLLQFEYLRKRDANEAREQLIDAWTHLHTAEKQVYLQKLYVNRVETDIPFLTEIYQSEERDALHFHAANLLSLLGAEIIQKPIEKILNAIHFTYSAGFYPILDFRWSDKFLGTAHYTNRNTWSKHFEEAEVFFEVYQALRLVPMDRWCEHFEITPQILLNGAYHGENRDLFFSAWNKRIINERHYLFAVQMMNFGNKPFAKRVQINRNSYLQAFQFSQLQDYVDKQLNKHKEI